MSGCHCYKSGSPLLVSRCSQVRWCRIISIVNGECIELNISTSYSFGDGSSCDTDTPVIPRGGFYIMTGAVSKHARTFGPVAGNRKVSKTSFRHSSISNTSYSYRSDGARSIMERHQICLGPVRVRRRVYPVSFPAIPCFRVRGRSSALRGVLHSSSRRKGRS